MPGNWYVHDLPVYGGNQVNAIIGRDKPAPARAGNRYLGTIKIVSLLLAKCPS